ncbi:MULTISPECIES: retron Ec78 anti-phage system effector HNH endonuclease PtuB [Serratia]|uniref:retron Ec78 anti-phage system effector HNH endonuclease PtuB n=1 Tax=Serratia TaxID=613 RepID=UPI0010D0B306|nr:MULTISPECIES: retron Ec78 anti-phage system effector HNH endonuclease PtuB [Serratia]RYM57647.1 TIGR02646 family protein [Serratia proteamaculans]CAI1728250.1 Uncharacterised protein [Serratia quinivorans]
MIKISKSIEHVVFLNYKNLHPTGSWDEFKDYQQGEVYKNIKNIIFRDQFDLCAYCEVSLPPNIVFERRIEHFKSKSGCDVHVDNWHLDWDNLLGVCLGGSNLKDKFDLPRNLSCDAYKEHYETINNIVDKNWLGRLLFPLDIPHGHHFFVFLRATGEIKPNSRYCNDININNNAYESTEVLVEKTIDIFNLNCERLKLARIEIFRDFERAFSSFRKNDDITTFKNLVIRWSRGNPSFFQTTRDIILRESSLAVKVMNGDL